jgi:hypothetical protein
MEIKYRGYIENKKSEDLMCFTWSTACVQHWLEEIKKKKEAEKQANIDCRAIRKQHQ